jgi:protein-disulfide isomerase
MTPTRLSVLLVGALVSVAACGETPTSAQAGASPATPAPAVTSSSDQVVAEVGGRRITLAEVDAKWQEFDAAERARVTQLLYQNRRNMLDLLVGDALIEEAARAANVEVAAYTEREITRRVQPVSEADIQRFYDENRERAQGRSFEDLKGPIGEFLGGQRRQQARAELVDELTRKAGGVRVLLDPPRHVVEVGATDPANGDASAPVTIVEFSDYQCPFCARVTPTMAKIMETYRGKVRRIFKDFPLANHPQAPKAAEAARCAGDQGKYWEFHARLFDNQSALQIPQLKETASSLGLDRTRFDQCLDSGTWAAQVKADLAQGEKLGVNSTPTLYVNGRPVIGAQPFDQFKQVIDEELARVR